MSLTSPRFVLLACLTALGLGACGGGSSLQPSLPIASNSGAAGTDSTRRATAVATPSATPAYSGVVSGVGLGTTQGFTANCDNHNNFGLGYSCVPVYTTGATLVGSEVVGAYFEAWGTVQPPNVTATFVVFSTTPFPTATAAPTPAPTATPTPVPPNGLAWPASFQPYSGSAIWSRTVEANPSYDPQSSTIIAAWFPGAGNGFPVRNQEPGPYDYTHPIYFASGTDPAVSITCQSSGGCVTSGANVVPASMRIPAVARAAESNGNGAGDSHIGVVQPNGIEDDLYCWNNSGSPTCNQPSGGVGTNWSAGALLGPTYSGDACGSFTSGTGQLPVSTSGNTTAGGACEGAGVLSPAQLIAGHINHALFLITNCANGNVYPAETSAKTNACSGTGPALGARLWYDVPDATTDANTALRPWEKAILDALHDYGGYVMDDVNGGAIGQGVQFLPESEEPAYRYGKGDQWSGLAAQGWTATSIAGAPAGFPRWTGADPWAPAGVNLHAHLHVLNACVTAGSC